MRKLMAKGGVIVANGVLGCEVDERSVFGVREALYSCSFGSFVV
jgi:hypothetical protein